MAELATIARPYADALFRAAPQDQRAQWVTQLAALASVAQDDQLRLLADNPKVRDAQVFDVMVAAAQIQLAPALAECLRVILENGRLLALPAISEQFAAQVRTLEGLAQARVVSAFPMSDDQVADLLVPLERRFGRKLAPVVEVDPQLIGGVRVLVGDEVLDTSVAARLERMKAALLA